MRNQAAIHAFPVPETTTEELGAADAYNQAGDDYLSYADGDPGRLYAFDGEYAFGDSNIWSLLDTTLRTLRASGQDSIQVLDAGCGPGTWLRRIIARAHQLGFTSIQARGFDLAERQVDRARRLSRDVAQLPGVTVRFEVGDLGQPLAEADASVDLCLCLYGVLNHLQAASLPRVVREFGRVTRGCFVTSVRSVGSTPSIFIDAIEQARSFHQDNDRDRCDIQLKNGRRVSFCCHLFAAGELHQLFADDFRIEDLRGLDLFHKRFSPDPRWNPKSLATDRLQDELRRLEETYARDPGFIDRAAHLLLIARGRPGLETLGV